MLVNQYDTELQDVSLSDICNIILTFIPDDSKDLSMYDSEFSILSNVNMKLKPNTIYESNEEYNEPTVDSNQTNSDIHNYIGESDNDDNNFLNDANKINSKNNENSNKDSIYNKNINTGMNINNNKIDNNNGDDNNEINNTNNNTKKKNKKNIKNKNKKISNIDNSNIDNSNKNKKDSNENNSNKNDSNNNDSNKNDDNKNDDNKNDSNNNDNDSNNNDSNKNDDYKNDSNNNEVIVSTVNNTSEPSLNEIFTYTSSGKDSIPYSSDSDDLRIMKLNKQSITDIINFFNSVNAEVQTLLTYSATNGKNKQTNRKSISVRRSSTNDNANIITDISSIQFDTDNTKKVIII